MTQRTSVPDGSAIGAGGLDGLALVVVDVQRGFDDAAHWGRRDNPACEANVARLLVAWRAASRPVVLVRHDSDEPGSPLRPGQDGNGFKDVITGEGDLLVSKSTNSCFYGTPDLHAWLVGRGLRGVVLCGITTNHCCETTARMGGNLGLDVLFVLDATHTFDRTAPDGSLVTAEELSRVTATNLHGEFATVVGTDEVVAALAPRGAQGGSPTVRPWDRAPPPAPARAWASASRSTSPTSTPGAPTPG